MGSNTISHLRKINLELSFLTPVKEIITLSAKDVEGAFISKDIEAIFLKLDVNFTQYQRIEQQELFNLKNQVKGALKGELFIDRKINIKLCLRPDLFASSLRNGKENFEKIIDEIIRLSDTTVDSTLRNTESWYCLEVDQRDENQVNGYETLWNRINFRDAVNGNLSEREVIDITVAFAKQQIERSQDGISVEEAKIQSILFEKLTHSFHDLSSIGDVNHLDEQDSTKVAQVISDLLEETLGSLIEKDANLESYSQDCLGQSIFDAMVSFFESEKWGYLEVDPKTTLRLAFQGDHGQWDCYAQAVEDYDRFIFYSVLPITIPMEKRVFCSEFITRANCGIGLGNFELNFETGEVKYKTSIEADATYLNTDIFQRLVYVNTLTFDRYLPGIIRLIDFNASPQEAIIQVENSN